MKNVSDGIQVNNSLDNMSCNLYAVSQRHLNTVENGEVYTRAKGPRHAGQSLDRFAQHEASRDSYIYSLCMGC